MSKTTHDKAVVSLYGASGVGLIVSLPSRIFFTSGTVKLPHPQLEGIYLPLSQEGFDPTEELTDCFQAEMLEAPLGGIDDFTADMIDEILEGVEWLHSIKVNRREMQAARKFWVPVTFEFGDDSEWISGLDSKVGILTWLNSD